MTFLSADERALGQSFERNGYIIAPAADRAALERIRLRVARAAAEFLRLDLPPEAGAFLDGIGTHVIGAQLNELRLAVIANLTADEGFRPDYFACGRTVLELVAGNELAMQRGVGLSVQLPDDAGSLLPLHSDAWSEDSPYEVVLWIPLVDCFRTKSMFLASPEVDARWRDRLPEFAGVEALYAAMEPEFQWLDIPYGNVLVFSHTLMHGNRVNREPQARWSMNVRFKGLFTPYSDKKLGDFFEPITLRAATKIGLDYRLPDGFHE